MAKLFDGISRSTGLDLFFKARSRRKEALQNPFANEWSQKYQPFETLAVPDQLQIGAGNTLALSQNFEDFLTSVDDELAELSGKDFIYLPDKFTHKIIPHRLKETEGGMEVAPIFKRRVARFFDILIQKAVREPGFKGLMSKMFGGQKLTSADYQKINLIWETDVLIAGGMDSFGNAEVLAALTAQDRIAKTKILTPEQNECLLEVFSAKKFSKNTLATVSRNLANIDLFFKSKATEDKAQFIEIWQNHPNQILLYLLNKIANTLMIPAGKMTIEQLTELENLRKTLRSINLVSITADPLKSALYSNINDAMVYLQELWISRSAPHAYAITHKITQEKIPLPDALKSNAQFTLQIVNDFFDKLNLIDADDKNWNIQASLKSPGSILAEVLSDRANAGLRLAIKTALKNRNLPFTETEAQTPMDEAFISLAELETLIANSLKNPDDATDLTEIITQIESSARNLQNIIRSRAIPINLEPDAKTSDQKLVEVLENSHKIISKYPPETINCRIEAVGVINSPTGKWSQKLNSQEIMALYNLPAGSPPDFQMAINFLKDVISSTPDGGVGFAMLYLLLPTRFNSTRQGLELISPEELSQMTSVQKETILWSETHFCLEENVPGNILNRPGWEARDPQTVMENEALASEIAKLTTTNRKFKAQDAKVDRKRQQFALAAK